MRTTRTIRPVQTPRADRCGAEGSVPVRVVLGLLIATLGALFLFENLGLIEGRDLVRRFWPGAFVAMGVAMLLDASRRGSSRLWGLVPIVAGVSIFARQEGWVQFDFWDVFFPGLLILFGSRLVLRSRRGPRERRVRGATDEGFVHAFAVMAGNEIRATSGAFRGAELGAFMGGVVLDLRNAKIESDQAVVEVFAMWAGIELQVPPDWRVVSKVVPLMGAFEDKTPPRTSLAEGVPAKTLLVKGFVVMGGVEIKG